MFASQGEARSKPSATYVTCDVWSMVRYARVQYLSLLVAGDALVLFLRSRISLHCGQLPLVVLLVVLPSCGTTAVAVHIASSDNDLATANCCCGYPMLRLRAPLAEAQPGNYGGIECHDAQPRRGISVDDSHRGLAAGASRFVFLLFFVSVGFDATQKACCCTVRFVDVLDFEKLRGCLCNVVDSCVLPRSHVEFFFF